MNLRIITKKLAADPQKGFRSKSIFKAVWPRNDHTASVGVKQDSRKLLVLISRIFPF